MLTRFAHRLISRPGWLALLAVALGPLVGIAVGWSRGNTRIQAITEAVRASNPNDPLDGLPYILLGHVFVGALVGTGVGVGLAMLIGFVTYARREYEL